MTCASAFPSPGAPRLLAWGAQVDGVGSLASVETALGRLTLAGIEVPALEIASLADPWDAPEDPTGRRFKSGCAPLLALVRAVSLLDSGAAEAVLVRGREPLRSGYPRDERRARMAIWPGLSIPEAYTRLARAFLASHGLSPKDFRRLADALLENYEATARRRGLDPFSPESRAQRVTDLFLLADCAHPEVDFQGAVLVGTDRAAGLVGQPAGPVLRLRAVAVETAPDGPAQAAALSGYAHLTRAHRRLEALAGEPLAARLREGEALFEAYTCFPVVPLGFLLATGLVTSIARIVPWLARHEITVTGGMNLARAPWNNPVLHALVVLSDRLVVGGPTLGLLHGNGGLGGWQGVALLEREAR